MHRIDHPTADPNANGDGVPGFTEGNPALGVPATVVTKDWLNDNQENLLNVLAAAGITPEKGNYEQLLEAIVTVAGLDIDALASLTVADDADALVIYDTSASAHKKINVSNLFTGRVGVDQVARDMAMITAFQQFIASSIAAGAFADWARVNTFPTDNLPTKTNAVYDAALKLYANDMSYSLEQGTSALTITSSLSWSSAFLGFRFDVGGSGYSVGKVSLDVLSGAATIRAKLYTNNAGSPGTLLATSNSVVVPGAGVYEFTFSAPAAVSASTSYWVVWEYVSGSGLTINHATNTAGYGSGQAGTATTITDANAHYDIRVGIYKVTAPQNMTLIDAAYTVPTAPLDGRVFLLHKFTTTGVLNTDIKVFMARNGTGSGGWVEGTLSLQDAFIFDTGYNVLVADFDLSAIATGTQPVVKIETYNTVEQRVRGIGSIAA